MDVNVSAPSTAACFQPFPLGFNLETLLSYHFTFPLSPLSLLPFLFPFQVIHKFLAGGYQGGVYEMADDAGNVRTDCLLKVLKKSAVLGDLEKEWAIGQALNVLANKVSMMFTAAICAASPSNCPLREQRADRPMAAA